MPVYPYYIFFVSYIGFAIVLWFCHRHHSIRLMDAKGLPQQPLLLLVLQGAGIFFFGCLPAYYLTDFRWTTFLDITQTGNSQIFLQLGVTLTASVLLAGISVRHALPERSVIQVNLIPAIPTLLVFYGLRLLFIFCYECWFRGHLFFASLQHMGFWPAASINIIAYSLLHLANGRKEVLACVPFGLLLCGICFWSHAVWPAVVIHSSLAFGVEVRQGIYLHSLNSKNAI